jgi:hypothetical protein
MAEKRENLAERVGPCINMSCSSFKRFFCRFGYIYFCPVYDSHVAQDIEAKQRHDAIIHPNPSDLPPQNYQRQYNV